MVLLSRAEKVYLLHGVRDNLRCDGRKNLDFRPHTLEVGAVPGAFGSARLHSESHDLVVAVKAEVVEGECAIIPSVSVSPTCNSQQVSAELAARVEEELVAAYSALHPAQLTLLPDLKQLDSAQTDDAAEPGPALAWRLHVDVLVLRADGSLLTQAALAARAALQDTQLPRLEVTRDSSNVDFEVTDQRYKVDVDLVPVLIGLQVLGGELVMDASAAEEEASLAQLSAAVTTAGLVTQLRVSGGGSVTTATLSRASRQLVSTAGRLLKLVSFLVSSQPSPTPLQYFVQRSASSS